MEANDIDPLINSEDDYVEVLIGLEQDASSNKLEYYMGEDGNILKSAGFDIYRVKLTPNCLRDISHAEPSWIEYVEPTEVGLDFQE